MKVLPIPCLSDNYAYLVSDDAKRGFVVDPVDPEKVLAAARKEGITIDAIINTHHHSDHSGGNEEFLKRAGQLPVYGGDKRIFGLTNMVQDQEAFRIGSLALQSLYTICHTTGSVSFYVEDQSDDSKAVFTGDTLFVGGCGRFFEGTPEQMDNSLNNVLARLPQETKVFCGHEYTRSNYKFALSVDPDNKDLQQQAQTAQNQTCTVPSTIGLELKTNPFMRLHDRNIRQHAGLSLEASSSEVMQKLRELKNNA